MRYVKNNYFESVQVVFLVLQLWFLLGLEISVSVAWDRIDPVHRKDRAAARIEQTRHFFGHKFVFFGKRQFSKIIFNLVNAEHFSELFGFDSQLHVLFLFLLFVSHKMFSDDSKKPTAGTELNLAKEGNPVSLVSCWSWSFRALFNLWAQRSLSEIINWTPRHQKHYLTFLGHEQEPVQQTQVSL